MDFRELVWINDQCFIHLCAKAWRYGHIMEAWSVCVTLFGYVRKYNSLQHHVRGKRTFCRVEKIALLISSWRNISDTCQNNKNNPFPFGLPPKTHISLPLILCSLLFSLPLTQLFIYYSLSSAHLTVTLSGLTLWTTAICSYRGATSHVWLHLITFLQCQ